MAGYTPVFGTVFTGTLHGRWPDVGLWLCVLALADKNGELDMTAGYIASCVGLDEKTVAECMERFCNRDPGSRSQEAGGARLVLLDPSREWGWRIVNHGKYKEKARLQSKAAREVSDGLNAERLRERRRPPVTACDPLSNANANINAEKIKTQDIKQPASGPPVNGKHRKTSPRLPLPPDFELTDQMRQQAISRYPDADCDQMFVQFRAHHESHGKAMKSWPAAWVTWVGNAANFGYPKRQGTVRKWD